MCVKCREVRLFCLFDDSNASSSVTTMATDVKVYRDVTWREATWEELGKLGLPMDPGAWRENENVGSLVRGSSVVSAAAATPLNRSVDGRRSGPCGLPSMSLPLPPLESLLSRLPIIPLPVDLPRHSYFVVSDVIRKI